MTTYESALSELSGRLIGTGSNLTSSLSEILGRSPAGADRGRADRSDRCRTRRTNRGPPRATQRSPPEVVDDPGG